ncbi:outer membrane protein assembly factor BamA [Sphingomonas sp. MAH-20]|uniref:Outer membrane protein assembly factor BamA n=1 Tax=Sphingomonas horti TaxID=2682842 RepID=A0A6I4J4W9_9SPHN|nr:MULTISPECIES: outer membrane protein assembly factor BamA [Sphingomonas]MBA2919340.1 outer membrane protein assembly factor BamA [Sphingomonas sp. CGMCC 1.13658]MVO78221.1 outer membrane protein assembly factor BamA [Sphingomonas horti]
MFRNRPIPALLAGTMLAGLSAPLCAQTATTPAPAESQAQPAAEATATATAPAPAAAPIIISRVDVVGSQRIEPDTVRSYIKLRPGDVYTAETGDQAIKDLFATELFADVTIREANGVVTIEVKENPVINRIIFEGNKRLKEDKILKEIRLAPRQIFTRSKVRADVARIIELYRRQGRYGATVDPQMVMLDQNRVDIVYSIHEGGKSRVQQINIIGNEKFSDGRLRHEMATKQARLTSFFSSNTTFDPDRLAYDQQKLRQFYLTEGYADFRVVSAIAELTPDKRDFIITYVVEEGDRYKYGDVKVESDLRDLKPDFAKTLLPMKKGDWYDAKQVEDTVNGLNETAGLLGYAFAEADPLFDRDPEKKEMNLTFRLAETPRVYVERININGNTITQDKVVRREFRLQEGDPFNTFQVKRSKDRIQSLGYFQEKFEIDQKPGSTPDRVILEANLEEKPTGSLSLSAGYSSLERFLINASIEQTNFRGMGQSLSASVNYSAYSKSVELGFTEPYFLDKNIALGGNIFRRDFNSFNFVSGNQRNTTYSQVQTGFGVRVGVPITEYIQLQGRYELSVDDVNLSRSFFTNGACDPLLAGRFLCDAIGTRTTSKVGYSLVYSTLDNGIRPTRGSRLVLSQDFAGLGGSVKYLKTVATADKYVNLGRGFVVNFSLQGGYIHSLEGKRFDASGNEVDPVRLIDRFYLGQPQMRGFDIRGLGPRVQRQAYLIDKDTGQYVPIPGMPGQFQVDTTRKNLLADDAIGGRAYYLGHIEMQIPLGSGVRELGIRPSVFVDIGSVFGVKKPQLINLPPGDPRLTRDILDINGNAQCTVPPAQDGGTSTLIPRPSAGCPTGTTPFTQTIPAFREVFLGDTPKPRVSVGFGVNWNSPFGPFRIDIAKALITQPGDDPQLVTFNVGTQF